MMKRLNGIFVHVMAIFVTALLPAIAVFWYVLGGFFADSAASDADRMRSAVMNQADRLTFDLDLELSLLDSYLTRGSDEIFADAFGEYGHFRTSPQILDAIREYSASARWPELVSALYVVESGPGSGGIAATRLSPADGYVDRYGAQVVDEYADMFEPKRIGLNGERHSIRNASLLSRAVEIRSDSASRLSFRILVAVLDEEVLLGTVLPALAAKYFGPGSGFDDYAVGARDASGALHYANAASDRKSADFARPLLRDSRHFDIARFYSAFVPRDSAGPPRDTLPIGGRSSGDGPSLIDDYRFQAMDLAGIWTLEVARRGLSIAEEARNQSIRWSMMAAGFLALLYGGVILLFLGARRASELASRERAFIASVTHELKTPIAVTLSAGENLSKGIVPMDRIAAYGDTVAREARRLADSVERLLVMAGLESAQTFRRGDPVEMAALVAKAASKLKAFAEDRGAEIIIQANSDAMADGSRVLMESAIECILNNAIKYAGGKITVTVREERRSRRRVVSVTCSDTGAGIPRAERRRIFEPFYRGRAATESGIQGTGIGLYLARRIARIHGGEARMKCPPDGGAVVELTFRSYQ